MENANHVSLCSLLKDFLLDLHVCLKKTKTKTKNKTKKKQLSFEDWHVYSKGQSLKMIHELACMWVTQF